MNRKKEGRQTVLFQNPPHIFSTGTVAGKKESEGPFGTQFDEALTDDLWGEKSWERAESKMIQQAVLTALKKRNLSPDEIDGVLSGDLLNQCVATTYGLRVFALPIVGLYGACSTMGLSMLLAAKDIDGGFSDRVACVTSSHFSTSERQFRMPLEYGGQRPPSAQWTTTGAACVILDGERGAVRVESATTGKLVDRGLTDIANMGGAMAPAAVDTLCAHFADTGTTPKDYDAIFTGDLGKIGKAIVEEQMAENGYDMSKNYFDCGELLFDQSQDVHAGASGCACSALVLCAHILPKLESGEYRSVLFAPTGALMSTLTVQQGESIPCVCHCLGLHS